MESDWITNNKSGQGNYIMVKTIGRLEFKDIKAIDLKMEEIFKSLSQNNIDKAFKILNKILNTQNYFVREVVGKKLTTYPDQSVIDSLVLINFTDSRIYGVRAAGLFYYWEKYRNEPNKLISLLDSFWDNTPWEVEAILADMWRRFPVETKKHMVSWLDSPNPKQRTLAFHGMEHVADEDPLYILECITKNIDDSSADVQKKMTHVITQVARTRPAECYPFLREWLLEANEARLKTVWSAMKKLVSIANQKNGKDRTDDFYILTKQTIHDWKNDQNEHVAAIGLKLYEEYENPGTVSEFE